MRTIFRYNDGNAAAEVVLTGVTTAEDAGFVGYISQHVPNFGLVVRQWTAWPTPNGYRIEMEGRTVRGRKEIFNDSPTWNLGLEVAAAAKR